MNKEWYLYILQCRDGTFYTGITVDVPRRYKAHSEGKGAKYTRSRGVEKLLYVEACGTHADALRRELTIKAMTRQAKDKLIRESTGNSAELK